MHMLHVAARDLSAIARDNGMWMTWNLLLALVPAALAPPVFRHRGERTALWWAGLALFVLFLPNAPYVITDLVHLRGDVVSARSDGVVVGAVLPVYAAFIGVGLLSYAFCVSELGRYLRTIGLGAQRASIELGVHLVAAVGVVLGRFARLNSWEPVTEPHNTLERAVLTLSARWAVVVTGVLFVVIWAAHGMTRAVVVAARDTAVRAGAFLHRLLTAPPSPPHRT
jgi:uncharacterized membrane protein